MLKLPLPLRRALVVFKATRRVTSALLPPLPEIDEALPPPEIRPLFIPVSEWDDLLPDRPQMSADEFAKYSACRDLDRWFEIRARDHRHNAGPPAEPVVYPRRAC